MKLFEVTLLESNPYVFSVNNNRISYTNDFKLLFMEDYNRGMKPKSIFEKYGFDTSILGARRIERAAFRWKESYSNGTLGTHKAYTFPSVKSLKEMIKDYRSEMITLKQRIATIEQHLDDIEKKI